MSEILTKMVANCTTGVVEVVPLSAEELAQREIDIAYFAAQQAEREAVEAAKVAAKASAQAKLAALGLTEEEIAALTE
jgi:hypothetical protein